MVEINLLVVISLYVLSFAIRGHEIHVQQGGAAVQVEFPAGDAVQAEIGSFRIGISRRGDAEDDVVQTYFAVDEVEQCGNAAVEAYIRVLHFHGTFLRTFMVVVSGVIGQCQQVGYLIFGDGALFQKFFCQQVHFVVDERAGEQSAEFIASFAVELIFEGLVPPFGQECIFVDGVCRFPYHVADAEVG